MIAGCVVIEIIVSIWWSLMEQLPNNIKLPNFEVSQIAIKLIKKYGKNAKKHPQDQIDKIKKSILEFGFRNPILINNLNTKEIVAGHGRLMAIILDLFGGSGSTLIACEQLNRSCYMMELDPKYCSVIIERWKALTGKEAAKIE